MSVRIRLRRVGRKKQPYYRVVVMPSTSPRDGAYIEEVGFYNPRTRPAFLTMDLDKVDAWLAKGAEVTESAASLIRKARKGGDDAVRLVKPGEEAPVMKTTARPERRPKASPAGAPPAEEPTDTLAAAAPDAEKAPPAEATQGETKEAVEALAPKEGVAETAEAPEAAPAEAQAPATEEAPAEAPAAQEPAADVAAAEEPAAEEPAAEEPAAAAESDESEVGGAEVKAAVEPADAAAEEAGATEAQAEAEAADAEEPKGKSGKAADSAEA
jgi:small subunit ribosomal protein S16